MPDLPTVMLQRVGNSAETERKEYLAGSACQAAMSESLNSIVMT